MFLPPSVTIMFFLRPKSCRWPLKSKRPASEHGKQLAAESFVHLAKQAAAELEIGTAAREQLVQRNHAVEEHALEPRQLVEFRPEPALEILEHHRDQAHVADAVTDES